MALYGFYHLRIYLPPMLSASLHACAHFLHSLCTCPWSPAPHSLRPSLRPSPNPSLFSSDSANTTALWSSEPLSEPLLPQSDTQTRASSWVPPRSLFQRSGSRFHHGHTSSLALSCLRSAHLLAPRCPPSRPSLLLSYYRSLISVFHMYTRAPSLSLVSLFFSSPPPLPKSVLVRIPLVVPFPYHLSPSLAPPYHYRQRRLLTAETPYWLHATSRCAIPTQTGTHTRTTRTDTYGMQPACTHPRASVCVCVHPCASQRDR